MSVLPVGQRLQQVIADLDELLLDPARYLGVDVVTIGPRKMYGLAALFGVGGLATLLSLFFLENDRGAVPSGVPERVAIGAGMLAGALFFLSWSLRLAGHRLVLRPEGVEIKHWHTTVWCPWALFNAEGDVYVPEADSPLVGLSLPVAVEAIPFVELRREDTPIAHGASIRCQQLTFTTDNRVVLPARYEVKAEELGALLLQLGRRLGRQLPHGEPPPEAYRLQEMDAAGFPEPDEAGWITVSLTRLHWPPLCCACGTDTSHTMSVALLSWTDRLFSLAAYNPRQLEIALPVCENCHEQIRQRQELGGRVGMLLGGVLLPGLAGVITFLYGAPELLVLLALFTLPVGAILGFGIGTAVRRRLPLQFRHYSPTRGTVSLRFRDRDRAGPLLEILRERHPTWR